jgi:hypothetical protein
MRSCFAHFGVGALCLEPSILGGHLNQIHKFGVFNINYALACWSATAGIHSAPPGEGNYIFGTMNFEYGLRQWGMIGTGILDANNGIIGEILFHPQSFLGMSGNIPQGGTKLKTRHINPTVQDVNVKVFTANGTWTKPSGASKVSVTAIGGGGGGWCGGRGGSGVAVDGGKGGGGGGFTQQTFDANRLTATVAVTVGAAQTGTPGRSTDGAPTWSSLAGNSTSFGSYLVAGGGSSFLEAGAGIAPGGLPGAGGVGAAVGAAGDTRTAAITSGGGGGGGIGADNVARAGGNGGATPLLSGGTGGAVGGAAGAGVNNADASLATGGSGGGGGASSVTAAGAAGAAGGRYGGGGGGGGASRTGFNSGAGGNGAAGICVVISE